MVSHKKHKFPLGSYIKIEGESFLYEICDYQDLLRKCPDDCNLDHDCYEEDYITCRPSNRTAFPVSKVKLVFVKHVGRELTTDDFED